MSVSWLFAQCAREVMIDLPEEESRVVAICHFTTGQVFKVRVVLSQPVYDTRDPVVPEKAEVTVAREGTFLDKLFRTTDDYGNVYWESRDLAETGVPYSISVRVDGLPAADAGSSIPVFSPIEPVDIHPADITESPLSDGRRLMNIPLVLHLKNVPAEKRYFAFYLKHDIELTDGAVYEGLSTNYTADGRTLSLLHDIAEPAVLINEKFWSDNRDSLLLNAVIAYNPAENEKPRRLYVEWRTLSEEFYKYHLSIDRQGSNLPLSDPDAIYNNVSGGYGNFSGYSVRVDTIELPF
ncbi:MAG: DUF4249 family protein [Haliscomenobacteraceae bacterium CHB4]|nr:hypothetical protein [Saprospiraceae bacterium]MCE7922149.1 DUF4249 family protein [Haliscomenobacteraceae bacterium CHB4]